jgi:hypothetical protein
LTCTHPELPRNDEFDVIPRLVIFPHLLGSIAQTSHSRTVEFVDLAGDEQIKHDEERAGGAS